MIRVLGTVFAALLGLAFGSFLNVCLSRWPEGESVVAPRSHCRNCGRVLVWWENVPLVSWLALRGRCRGCNAWIGWRYVIVEAAMGALWAIVAWGFPTTVLGPSDGYRVAFYDALLTTVGQILFFWLLVALAVLDAENLWLPNWLTLPGTVAGFVATMFSFVAAVNLDSIAPWHKPSLFQYDLSQTWPAAFHRLTAILAAAGLILLIRWTYWLVRRREGIGLGDAKLMAMLAAWLGFRGALLAFGLGVVLGAVAGLVVIIAGRQRDSDSLGLLKLPLGTFLCIGGIVAGLWGQQIIHAYMRWAGL